MRAETIRSDFFNLLFKPVLMNPFIFLFLFLGMIPACLPGAKAASLSNRASEGRLLRPAQHQTVSVSVGFVREFSFQRIRGSVDELDQWVFLTMFRDGIVARLDLNTGKTLETISSSVSDPESVVYNPLAHSAFVALGDSRSFLVTPIREAGPPFLGNTGLNPSWVGGSPALGYYLLAGAVHILYSLDRNGYHTKDWIALGDKVDEITFDPERKKIYFPLFRKGQVKTVSVPEFRMVSDVDIDLCHHPKTVLSDGTPNSSNVLVLCRNGLFGGNALSGGFKVLKKFGERPGMMARIARSKMIAISFPDAHEIRILDQNGYRVVKEFPTRGRPVFLFSTQMKNSLLVVSDRPELRKTQLVSYEFDGSALAAIRLPSGKNKNGIRAAKTMNKNVGLKN